MTAPIWLRPTETYFHYNNTISLKEQFDFTNEFVREIENLCDSDKYNVVAYKHLGDVFYFLGIKNIFEEIYDAPICFILLPQHEFLAKLWGIKDYKLFPIDNLVRKNKRFITAFFDDPNPASYLLDLLLDNVYMMAAFSSIPQKGRPFLLENLFNAFAEYPYYWCFRWASSVGIEKEFRFSVPKGRLKVSASISKKLERLGRLKKIILFAPEAATAIELPPEWWALLAEKLTEKGYKIIVNSKRINIANAISAFDLGLTLEDVVALGLNCRAVFALRSGLCDVLVGAGERLYVFSPAMLRREQYSLSYPFDVPTRVKEIQIYNWDIQDCEFEGLDVSGLLRPYINKCKYQYLKEWCLSLFNKKHRFWYRVYRNIAGKNTGFPENNVMNPLSGDRNLRIGFLSIYSRSFYKKDNDQILERSFLGGIFSIQKRNASVKYKILKIPVFVKKYREYKTLQVLGMTVYRSSRRNTFYRRVRDLFVSLAEEVYGENAKPDHVFVVRHNVGETSIYLSVLDQWIRQVGAKRPLFIVWRRRDLPFVNLFLSNRPYVRFCEIVQSDINEFFKDDITDLEGIQVHCPTSEIAESMKNLFKDNKDINFCDYILSSMNLESWKGLKYPTTSEIAENRATWLLSQKEIKTPFVLLCPEAVSIKPVDKIFWIKIIEYFEEKGYIVLLNVYANDSRFLQRKKQTVKLCSPDIEVLFAIARRAERIVSMASGLGVLLSLAQRPIDLIYTGLKNRHIGYSAEFCQKVYSVHHMPWNEVREFAMEYIADDVEKLLEEIKNRKF